MKVYVIMTREIIRDEESSYVEQIHTSSDAAFDAFVKLIEEKKRLSEQEYDLDDLVIQGIPERYRNNLYWSIYDDSEYRDWNIELSITEKDLIITTNPLVSGDSL